MNEFLKRLKETVIKFVSTSVALVAVFLFVMVMAGVLLVLPMWLLNFVIGKYAAFWVFILPAILMADKIYKWFKWQFIEPFTK